MAHPLIDRVRQQVEAVHAFFAAWFGGTLPARDETFQQQFLDHFHPGFTFVSSAGTVLDLDGLAREIRAAHGASPGLAIAVHDIRIRHVTGQTILATYEEWQRHDGDVVGVVASVWLERADTLRWLHVHETPLNGAPPADMPLPSS
ncbi:MAG: hypothetical protein U5S82_17525 [Gammaproteobacteria bacterium]|nr:hypothetical protein [Gammaproteobacteria bacterium]